MTILTLLTKKEIWQEFLTYKLGGERLTAAERKSFCAYIESGAYEQKAVAVAAGGYRFSVPVKKLVNKSDSQKKRAVYMYDADETMILRLVAYLLYRYDGIFSPCLFSFRKASGPKKALRSLISHPEIDSYASCKMDISDYFNSIDTQRLCAMLKEIFADDEPLYEMFCSLLLNDDVMWQGQVIREKKGVMAGVPVSSFLANVYLRGLDSYFYEEGIIYARYSDDMILFAPPAELPAYAQKVRDNITGAGLRLNEEKTLFSAPGEAWTFLGFKYAAGVIDISPSAERKIKGKIKRKARALRRWMARKNASGERALRAMNRKFNKKFYYAGDNGELNWSLWYFPVINTAETLKRIDDYMQQCQRYIVTGRHNKKNYELAPYSLLCDCGYRPLVAAYYRFKGGRDVTPK